MHFYLLNLATLPMEDRGGFLSSTLKSPIISSLWQRNDRLGKVAPHFLLGRVWMNIELCRGNSSGVQGVGWLKLLLIIMVIANQRCTQHSVQPSMLIFSFNNSIKNILVSPPCYRWETEAQRNQAIHSQAGTRSTEREPQSILTPEFSLLTAALIFWSPEVWWSPLEEAHPSLSFSWIREPEPMTLWSWPGHTPQATAYIPLR